MEKMIDKVGKDVSIQAWREYLEKYRIDTRALNHHFIIGAVAEVIVAEMFTGEERERRLEAIRQKNRISESGEVSEAIGSDTDIGLRADNPASLSTFRQDPMPQK